MPITRREFVSLTASGIAVGIAPSVRATPRAPAPEAPACKAIAFDALAIFDPRPVFALAEELAPPHAPELSDLWRTRQFEYTWLRAAMGRYADFQRVTHDALVFALKKLKIDLPPTQRDRLLNTYLELKAWPDAPPALAALKKSGCRLAILSNFTPRMLESCAASAGLHAIFEHLLSTDAARTYKPAPAAYQLAIDTFNLKREEILFVPFAGWDAAGAKAFGYPTFWANRLGLPPEELGEAPDAAGADLSALVRYVNR